MASTTSSTSSRSLALPSGGVLLGSVYAVCVLGAIAVFAALIAFTDVDPHRKDGPIDSMVSIGGFGTIALLVAAALTLWLRRSASTARVGAFVLLALSVVSLPFFWCGAPGLFGAGAAWLGGMAKGSTPQSGGPRVAGLVGVLIAALNVVFTVVGFAVAIVHGDS